MSVLEELHFQYASRLMANELRFETHPIELWRFRLIGTTPLTVEIENMGFDLYSIILEEPELDFEIGDESGSSLADFLRACAVSGLVKVSWSLGLWRGWWLEDRDGVAVSVERRSRNTRWSRLVESMPGYRESRTVLWEPGSRPWKSGLR